MLMNHETAYAAHTYSGRPESSSAISTQYVQITTIRWNERVMDDLDVAAALRALDSDEPRFGEGEVRSALGL